MKEARSSKRFPIASVASISAQGLHESSEVQVRDLSIQGMGCSGTQAYEKGDKIHVTLKLPTTPEGACEESVIGEIAWVEKFEDVDQAEIEYAFGIEFKQMETQNPRLYDYVRCLGEFFL